MHSRIADLAYYGCSSLQNIVLPKGITKIEYGLFADCSALSDITIPKGITHIDAYILDGCNAINSIVIPESVIYIEYGAFYWNNGLDTIYFMGTEKEWIEACSPLGVGADNSEIFFAPHTTTEVSADMLILYDNGKLVEFKKETYSGKSVKFTTNKTYTNAKVMAWKDYRKMTPVSKVEQVV